jgi:hypothetical protein
VGNSQNRERNGRQRNVIRIHYKFSVFSALKQICSCTDTDRGMDEDVGVDRG